LIDRSLLRCGLDALAFAELCCRRAPDMVYDWWNFPP
jgi:hypothetical protein